MLSPVFLQLLALVAAIQASYAFTVRSWDEASALANATVAQLTLSEKIGLVTGVGEFSSRCVGNVSPVSRLGIPGFCMNDGPAGVRLVKGVTGFPPAIAVAQTFSRRLMRARGVALGEEFRGKGIHHFLGPALDLMRNPKAGRGWESFGPDPYLTGEAAFETITGVQSVGVQAVAKHFIANNQEHWRYGYISNVDDRTMHEMYYFPFLRAIEANVSAVMCAYNQFNGTSACHNANLIGPQGLLRTDGFKGFIVSDWGATHDSASDNANAGLDMEQPGDFILIGGGTFGGFLGIGSLESDVNSGAVTLARMNQMVTNLLTPWYRLGQDSGYPEVNYDVQNPDGSGSLNLNVSVRSDNHTALAREIASASVVLLKNTAKTLPLQLSALKTVAIVGLDAIMPDVECGDSNENMCDDGTMSIGWGSGSNLLDFTVPPITALNETLSASGISLKTSLSNDLSQGPAAATGADMAIVFVNAMSGELGFYQSVNGNEGDRNDLELWFSGSTLITNTAQANPNTVVVVHSVGPVDMSAFASNPNVTAIVYAGAPGEQTGPGLVDVLTGIVNPSGRLPFSIADVCDFFSPRTAHCLNDLCLFIQVESDYNTTIVTDPGFPLGFPVIDYTETLFLDYRSMDAAGITPRYEFGFGLSYTTFEYLGLSISTSGSSQIISFQLKNSGGVAGTEIPQLYLGFPPGSGEPPKVLRGFDEVFLEVGGSEVVSMTVDQRGLSAWDTTSQSWVRPSGTFNVFVGASSRDIRLQGSF
ncbi:glycoside hydrolase family 3 protein [Roridomyces roridus]|uniref:beta-glucosidase n=1 Tax=Roridomyces roridus TaxID=1738132 RepID=A0AAD7B367_9AGAR|nr:glycoside hydrolase family 3 protein [Roridomyces roridus]